MSLNEFKWEGVIANLLLKSITSIQWIFTNISNENFHAYIKLSLTDNFAILQEKPFQSSEQIFLSLQDTFLKLGSN